MNNRLDLPFTGITTFCRSPVCPDVGRLEADAAVLGVPFDMSVQGRPGARFGPRGIREASMYEDASYYDVDRDEIVLAGVRIVDCGDVDIIHMNPAASLQNARTAVRQILAHDVFLVVLGGDHAVSIPVVDAFADRGPFHVIQFDAHLDFCDERFGVREGHNNPMRRISEMEHVEGITQIGIRGAGSSGPGDFADARRCGSRIVSSRAFRRMGVSEVLRRIPRGRRYYVTVDCDVLDPSVAPGVGWPAPGGLTYYDLLDALIGIASLGEVVGFDVCEVAPVYDPAGVTCHAVAKIIIDFLAAVFRQKAGHAPAAG